MRFLKRKATDQQLPAPTLRFTGTCDREAFDTACSRHDWWYHTFRFDNGYEVRGDYDIAKDIESYRFPKDMRGLRVLDIGIGAGWFSLYFEQQGAEVTAWDPRGWSDFDLFGRYEYPPIESEKPTPDVVDEQGRPVYLSAVSGAFWTMRGILDSKIPLRAGKVYDLGLELFDNKPFDLVFMGALLLHLRDPIGALMAARRVCSGQLYATTSILEGDGDEPFMALPFAGKSANAWWRPNRACFQQWFMAAGFKTVDVESSVPLTVDLAVPEHHNVDQVLQLGIAAV